MSHCTYQLFLIICYPPPPKTQFSILKKQVPRFWLQNTWTALAARQAEEQQELRRQLREVLSDLFWEGFGYFKKNAFLLVFKCLIVLDLGCLFFWRVWGCLGWFAGLLFSRKGGFDVFCLWLGKGGIYQWVDDCLMRFINEFRFFSWDVVNEFLV